MYGLFENERIFQLISLFFLCGVFLLTLCSTALTHLGKFQSKQQLRSSRLFFFTSWEHLLFSLSINRSVYAAAYAIAAFLFLPLSLPAAGAILGLLIAADLLATWAASLWSRPLLHIAAPLSLLCSLPLLPINLLLFYIGRLRPNTSFKMTNKTLLREMIKESDLHPHLEPSDQKLISSFIHFKERVAKEIMVPRVDLFSLSAETSIREATRLFASEGYSRIPIYRDTLDQIVGVVLYKDLLKFYVSAEQNLDAPLETIAKPVLYAPENKKVSQLFQDFRVKQIHMAIIVDEYGGTEGIVTIEDILEELVGEIEDEYDIGEENSFLEIPGQGWIIDAKMTLFDIAEQLGVHIPTNPEYETLGGYVYHCAGTIPMKGWRLSHDAFDLEVVSSNERALKKIKIQPRNLSN